MKAKTKKFTHKLIALVLAVVMALTCFSGTLSAFAGTDPDYHDGNVEYNELAWAVLNDEQTAAALLDYLDEVLGGLNLHVKLYYDVVVAKVNIDGYLDSVSGALQLVGQVYELLNKYGGLVGGDVSSIDLSPLASLPYNGNTNESRMGRAYRERNSAKEIVQALFKTIYANVQSNKVIKKVLKGTLDLGLASSAKDTLYDAIGGLVGTNSTWEATYNGGTSYETNMVYNIVRHVMYNAFDQYSPMGSDNYNRMMGQSFDQSAFELLSKELLQKININVTYKDRTSSQQRFADGNTNSRLKYTDNGNVYLFYYDFDGDGTFDGENESLTLSHTDNLFDFSYKALHIAWYSVLKDTLEQLNVAGLTTYDWDYSQYCFSNKIDCDYGSASITAWAQEVIGREGSTFTTTDEFLAKVKSDLTYDREISADATGTWRDIDSHTIFGKLCYSPLADKYFNMQTGPLNLTLATSGLTNLENFDWNSYTSIVGGFNDFLVAAMNDLLPDVDNVDGSVPYLTSIGNTTDPDTIAATLVENAAAVVNYIADATDKNVLAGMYANGESAVSESNIESAITPLLIACLQQNLGLVKQIHDEKWDACKDFEGVAYIALEEYLSYVLPEKDYSVLVSRDADNKYDVTLEGAIMPMCRDAVAFVMYEYVPIYDKNGNFWDVYTSAVDCEETIFDLLNSVVCYYANTMGVGNLLGLCDKSGNCTITTSNTLWQNIDLVVNKFLPVLGSMLGYGTANADSYDLIFNKLINGLLNIGENSGLTNLVKTFMTICTNEAITTQSADITVYNFLRDLLNGIFGARYNGQSYTSPVPAVASDHPFDDFIQIDEVAGGGSNSDIGWIGEAITNIVEFAGNYNYPDTVWSGAMFIVQAVSSLVPSFLPQLAEYKLNPATFSTKSPSVSSYVPGSSINKYGGVTVTNNSNGINRALINKDGSTTQQSRYYVKVTDVTCDTEGLSIGSLGGRINPKETYTVPVTGSLSDSVFTNKDDYKECLVTFTVTYDYVDQNGNVIGDYSGMQTNAFQYFTTAKDWKTLTYNEDGSFVTSYGTGSGTQDGGAGATSIMSGAFASAYDAGSVKTYYACAQYPKSTIVKLSEAENIGAAKIWLVNNLRNNTSLTIEGMYAYNPSGLGADWAIVASDAQDNIINSNWYDYYRIDENGNGAWVTDDPRTYGDVTSFVATNVNVTDYRKHVIATPAQYDAVFGSGKVKKDAAGNICLNITNDNCSFLNTQGNKDDVNYANNPTFSAGIDGLYFSIGSQSQGAGGTSNGYDFLAWDGETSIKAETIEKIGLMIYHTSNKKSYDNWSLSTYDDSEAPELMSQYTAASEFLSQYTESDFKDYSAAIEQSPTYQYYLDVIKSSLATYSTAVTTANARTLDSVKANNPITNQTTSFYGDKAYVPATSVIDTVAADAVKSGNYYYITNYIDADNNNVAVHENPIYSNVELMDADVTMSADLEVNGVSYPAGTDVLGYNVVKVDGVWYYQNAPAYEYKWADAGSGEGDLYQTPYYAEDTSTPLTTTVNGEEVPLYNQKQFIYRDAQGVKTTSKDDWAYKFIDNSYSIVKGINNRGVYKVAADKLTYANLAALGMIEVKGADVLYNSVTKLREGLNNVNFGIVTYEKMVTAAKDAEALIVVDRYRTYTDKEGNVAFSCYDSDYQINFDEYSASKLPLVVISSDLTSVEDESKLKITSAPGVSSFDITEAVRVFNMYLAKIVDRGYEGTKLEEEIVCASNSDYTAMTAVIDETSSSVSTTASSVKYGAVQNGQIVNNGEVKYSDQSWNAYITALAAAVNGAANGNGGYVHRDREYYNATDKESYTLQVSDVYALRTNLMIAENNLAPADTGFTVTGTMKQMVSTAGDMGAAAPGLTVTIGNLSAVTAADGTFTIEGVPEDATAITVSGDSTVDRTIALDTSAVANGVLNIGEKAIVCCDYAKNGSINPVDLGLYSDTISSTASSDRYNVYADFNGDGSINPRDTSVFMGFMNRNLGGVYDSIAN